MPTLGPAAAHSSSLIACCNKLEGTLMLAAAAEVCCMQRMDYNSLSGEICEMPADGLHLSLLLTFLGRSDLKAFL